MSQSSDEWAAYLVGVEGFVVATEEQDEFAREVLALIDDPDEIDSRWGDRHPESIVVARRSGAPSPQYEGSDILRMPGTYKSEDAIEITEGLGDVIEPDHALLMWVAARGAAKALNHAS